MHWRGIARCTLTLNALYAAAWLAIDLMLLRNKEINPGQTAVKKIVDF